VRVCNGCIKDWYPLPGGPVLALLMLDPRVTIVSGAQDKTVIGPSRSKLRFSSQVLPSVFIKSQRPNPFHVVSQILILLLVPSLPKGKYVFTKDIKQLTADLEAADDQEAVILRYSNALIAKNEVRCESGQILVSPYSCISKFAQALGSLERSEKANRKATLSAAHAKRIDQ